MSQTRVPITIRLDCFEGPLDLLLYLIQSHELDISKVSLSKITDQYLSTIRFMQGLSFDMASEFLVMAATLLYWKSKAILPKDGDDAQGNTNNAEDDVLTPEDLVRQLLEHRRFLAAGDDLGQFARLGEDVFARPNGRPAVERVWREMSVSDLVLSYQDTVVRSRRQRRVLRKETVSISQKIFEFADKLELGKITPLDDLISGNRERPEVVVAFLASLELSRLKKLRLHQQLVYHPIYLELITSLKGFDMQIATGFDAAVPPREPESAQEVNHETKEI